MTPAEQIRADQIKRLAGLADVVGALLAAIPIMDSGARGEALQTCASLADDIANDLADLVGGAT